MSKLERTLIKQIGDTNEKFNLFKDKETILVGISGGKDSLALFSLLKNFNLNILPVHICFKQSLPDFFTFFNETTFIRTNINELLTKDCVKQNYCFVCSKQRRKLLIEYAEKHNVTKLCLGHHKNDVIETFFMNILYSREISTILPMQKLFNGKFNIIRPLYEIDEFLIKKYCEEQKFNILKCQCEYSNNTKRVYVKEYIEKLKKDHPKIDIYDNIYSSLKHIKSDFLPFKIF